MSRRKRNRNKRKEKVMPVQVNSGGTTSGGTTYKTTQCYHGRPRRVFRIGSATFFAGAHRDYQGDNEWALRVRLADTEAAWELSGANRMVNAYNGAELLFPKVVTSPIVIPTMDIEWHDYMAPFVPLSWWTDFVLSVAKWEKPMDVGVSCMGGHGRTGTFLAIVAQLGGLVPEGTDPITWVRENYCDRAVESWTQALYIQRVTGKSVNFGEKKTATVYRPSSSQRSWLDREDDSVIYETLEEKLKSWDSVSTSGAESPWEEEEATVIATVAG